MTDYENGDMMMHVRWAMEWGLPAASLPFLGYICYPGVRSEIRGSEGALVVVGAGIGFVAAAGLLISRLLRS